MATYKELKDRFFEEVGNVDLSKLGLGFNGLKDYAELLKIMAEIPEETGDEKFKYGLTNASALCAGFGGASVPRIDDKEE